MDQATQDAASSLYAAREALDRHFADQPEEVQQHYKTQLSVIEILNAMDYPVVRIFTDNALDFVNNTFLEYGQVEGLREVNGRTLGSHLVGRSILEFLPESEHQRFEQSKELARAKRRQAKQYQYRVGIEDEFTFLSSTGKQTPMMVSITYAMIYDRFQLNFRDITDLKQAQSELLAAHDELEDRVRARTADLEEANAAIRQQTEAIKELSTPVIRLTDEVLLMPLIGVLDTQRANAMTERLLGAIAGSATVVAILDVTGVPFIDTSVARHLLMTVDGARMLGVAVILTGFRPEIAQTVVRAGIDLRAVRTRGSLQAGITEALGLVGKRIHSLS